MKDRIANIYAFMMNEEDARTCADISEEACRNVPLNFILIIISNTFTKFGDALSNPKTVLAWLMSYINARSQAYLRSRSLSCMHGSCPT